MKTNLAADSVQFLNYLDRWFIGLPVVEIDRLLEEPSRVAILSVDVINGFCASGPLASDRVARIVPPIVEIFKKAHQSGVKQLVLLQDTHEEQAVEFGSWPAHCIRGGAESEPVKEFTELSFFEQMVQIPKNSIASHLNTGLDELMKSNPDINTFIVVGDCTDLCTYQLAMHLRLQANAYQLQRRVIVPANAVDTYDRSVEAAETEGGLPHPGDLTHAMFLYHMALNGVEVVSQLK